MPYFKKSQTHELGEDAYRGGEGPLHVSRGKTDNPLFHAWIEAGMQAGYPFTDDMNGYQQVRGLHRIHVMDTIQLIPPYVN